MDRIVPGVDMPLFAAVVRKVTRRAHENTRHMHQFAEWKIGKQRADEEQMNVEDGADPLRDRWIETDKSHGKHLHAYDICFVKISHEHPGDTDAEDQEKREVIIYEGNIPDLGKDDPSGKKEQNCPQQHNIGNIQERSTYLQEAVE